MGKPHVHAEFICAKANGAVVQEKMNDQEIFFDMGEDDFDFVDNYEYRIKPEPVFPVTRMTQQQIKKAFHASAGETEKGWRGIANAAIRRAIEDGDVILPNKD